MIIRNIANCEVKNSFTFYECLYKYDMDSDVGNCLSEDQILKLDAKVTGLGHIFNSLNFNKLNLR
jgi:hypothetical protein